MAPASTAFAKVLRNYQEHLAQNSVVLQHFSEVLFALACGFRKQNKKPQNPKQIKTQHNKQVDDF